jgi:hypothetical protein
MLSAAMGLEIEYTAQRVTLRREPSEKLDQVRGIGRIALEPLGDPAQQRVVFQRAGGEALSAAMRQRADRLFQQQAPRWVLAVDSAAQLIARERQEIGRRVLAAQRKFKAVLALLVAVASALIATGL